MTIHIVVSMNSQCTVARTPLQYGHIMSGNMQTRKRMAIVSTTGSTTCSLGIENWLLSVLAVGVARELGRKVTEV